MKSNHTELPRRIRYTRKSTERADRQAASHAQQIEEMDRRWGPIDSSLLFQDSHTGTTFDRPKFQKLIRICEEYQRPREDPGRIEMYAPSRFGRILDKSGKPDIGAYMSQYLALKSLGWNLEFITVALSGVEMADLTLIVVHACQSAEFSASLSKDVSRGKRSAARQGWFASGVAPFGTRRYDTRAERHLAPGDASTSGGGGVILVPHEDELRSWEAAARAYVEGASLEGVSDLLYARGIRSRKGNKKTCKAVQMLLSHPALIGRVRFTDRDTTGRAETKEVDAQWGSLVDDALFKEVGQEYRRRSAHPRNKKRKARSTFPLRPVCFHCGVAYHGGRNSKAVEEARTYVHPRVSQIFDRDQQERALEYGCRQWSVDADELEAELKREIVKQRGSEDFEQTMKDMILQQDQFLSESADVADSAARTVKKLENEHVNLVRTISDASRRGHTTDLFWVELGTTERQLETARSELSAAQEFAVSRERAWGNLSEILSETRAIAAAWEDAQATERKLILDYWIDDVWIVVEPIPGKNEPTTRPRSHICGRRPTHPFTSKWDVSYRARMKSRP